MKSSLRTLCFEGCFFYIDGRKDKNGTKQNVQKKYMERSAYIKPTGKYIPNLAKISKYFADKWAHNDENRVDLFQIVC